MREASRSGAFAAAAASAAPAASVGPMMAETAHDFTSEAGTNSTAQVKSSARACLRYRPQASTRMSATPLSGSGAAAGGAAAGGAGMVAPVFGQKAAASAWDSPQCGQGVWDTATSSISARAYSK